MDENIEAMNRLIGYDIVIVSTSDIEQENYWQVS